MNKSFSTMHYILILLLIFKLSNFNAIIAIDFCRNAVPPCIRQTSDYWFSDGCYRAAVFEHDRIDEIDIHQTIETNLRILKEAIREAAKQDAKIIVLPEDGIFWHANKSIAAEVCEEIPDPMTLDDDTDNPCIHQVFYEDMPILRNLSCSAYENQIYIVANFGSKHYCTPGVQYDEGICFSKGYFMLNTNVVFDSTGRLIQRYRKYNTYDEIFDKSPSLDRIYFDTDFGRFGIMTCFDILFHEPAIDLVKQDKVNTILFPTWWYDELPYLSAISFQDAWSRSMGVSLLAANIHKRHLGSAGSGIYARDSKHYIGASNSKSKLLIKSLPIDYDSTIKCAAKDLVIEFDRDQTEQLYEHLNMTTTFTDTIEPLKSLSGTQEVCTNTVCCSVEYSIANDESSNLNNMKHIVILVRDALRHGKFLWYEQVCSIVTLESPYDGRRSEQYEYLDHGLVKFDKLILSVKEFATSAVFPIAYHKVDQLLENGKSSFTCNDNNSCELKINDNSKPINVAALYGRVFWRDRIVRIKTEIPMVQH